jgi:hypothetical protein
MASLLSEDQFTFSPPLAMPMKGRIAQAAWLRYCNRTPPACFRYCCAGTEMPSLRWAPNRLMSFLQ